MTRSALNTVDETFLERRWWDMARRRAEEEACLRWPPSYYEQRSREIARLTLHYFSQLSGK